MITVIGTSHVSMEGFEKAKKLIETHDCLALELCTARYIALRDGKQGKPQGILMRILAYIQKKLGHITGVKPGGDMLEATRLARSMKKKVYLIDQPIENTVKAIGKAPIIEKIKLFLPAKMPFDIHGIPNESEIAEITTDFKSRTPYLYSQLIDKRNAHMSACIKKLEEMHENVLVMVGAGHVPGIKSILGDGIRVL